MNLIWFSLVDCHYYLAIALHEVHWVDKAAVSVTQFIDLLQLKRFIYPWWRDQMKDLQSRRLWPEEFNSLLTTKLVLDLSKPKHTSSDLKSSPSTDIPDPTRSKIPNLYLSSLSLASSYATAPSQISLDREDEEGDEEDEEDGAAEESEVVEVIGLGIEVE